MRCRLGMPQFVTGTWSRQWGKDKFGNRAIEVRDFSGESTGLGSGAIPPGIFFVSTLFFVVKDT